MRWKGTLLYVSKPVQYLCMDGVRALMECGIRSRMNSRHVAYLLIYLGYVILYLGYGFVNYL